MTQDTDENETSNGRETMADVDHTHPHTDEAFASTGVYDRGEEQAADPGAGVKPADD